MSDPAEVIVPVIGILVLFGGPVAAFIVIRVLAHRERVEMIRRGMVPPPRGMRAYRQWARYQPGPAAWTAGPAQTPQAPFDDEDPQRALYKGIRLALIGFAMLVGLSFIGGTPGTFSWHGGPWLLGGLIPMFVGIAQIVIALISGAVLPLGLRSTYTPPPPPASPYPPPPTAPAGSWEQPGRARFEEQLSKPPTPPDRTSG